MGLRLSSLRAAVLGRPVGHSRSPALHHAAWAALGLDGRFEAIDCGVDELPSVLAARPDWDGFACTMPLKHAALSVATDVRPSAAAVGSANTLLPGSDGWIADNTDVHGIVAALRECGVTPGSVTMLGAGGTAQAVLGALAELAVPACTVLVRDPARAAALRATADRVGVAVRMGRLGAALTDDLVVSTLPPGVADAYAERAWRCDQALLDVAYGAGPTRLARAAAAGGATVVGGLLMLLHQAARQVELMTGRPAPVEIMRAALG